MQSTFAFNRPYVRDAGGNGFTPVYHPGENYSFYCNFNTPVSEASTTFQLCLITPLGDLVFSFTDMQFVIVSGDVGYHLYFPDFLFPSIPDGQYYFQILRLLDGNEVGRSNLIICSRQSLETTSYVEFKHNDVLFGVRYDLIPEFYQRFRLPINLISAIDISSQRDEYRQSSEQRELRVSKSFRDIKQKLELYWGFPEDYEALSAMLEHSNVIINGLGLILLDQVKVEQVSEQSKLYKGTFTVITKEPEAYGFQPEAFLRGGNLSYIYENLYVGGNL